MNWLLYPSLGILILNAVAIAKQDFRDRLIDVRLIILFYLFNTLFVIALFSPSQILLNTMFSLSYVSFTVLVSYFYFSCKKQDDESFFDNYLGWGDVILLIPLGCSFEPLYFIFFCTISLSITLLIHFLWVRDKKVPLAGYMVLIYCSYHTIKISV